MLSFPGCAGNAVTLEVSADVSMCSKLAPAMSSATSSQSHPVNNSHTPGHSLSSEYGVV